MLGLFKKGPASSDAKRDFFRACHAYCRPDADEVIVASVYNHGGLLAEKPGGTAMAKLSDATALDAAVRAALEACQFEAKFDYSEQKKSDWPAYQASGLKTMKSFEAEFVHLLVRGVNEKNLFYRVTTPEFGEFGLHLAVTVNAFTGNHGEAIQYVLENYLSCKDSVE